MGDFNTALLREKFLLNEGDANASEVAADGPLIVASNRLRLPLEKDGKKGQFLVVRTQTMHTCVRLAGKIMAAYYRADGHLLNKETLEWHKLWDQTLEDHEKNHNPNIWGTIYLEGEAIFHDGQEQPFLNLVEKYDYSTPHDYDTSVRTAEKAFEKAGKKIRIIHDSTVGLVVNVSARAGRCGIILRSAYKTSTFNYTVESNNKSPVNAAQCLSISAAYLEGIQLSFRIGRLNALAELGEISRNTPPYTEVVQAKARLPRLSREIKAFEENLSVRYRPERPDFEQLIKMTERETIQRFETEKASKADV